MVLLYALGVVGLVLAGFYLFGRDTVWRWTAWNYRYQGVKAERTPQWEAATTVQGVVLLVVSLVLFGLGASLGAPTMSGTYVGGHRLTQDEVRAYRKDPKGFLTAYRSQNPSACQGH